MPESDGADSDNTAMRGITIIDSQIDSQPDLRPPRNSDPFGSIRATIFALGMIGYSKEEAKDFLNDYLYVLRRGVESS